MIKIALSFMVIDNAGVHVCVSVEVLMRLKIFSSPGRRKTGRREECGWSRPFLEPWSDTRMIHCPSELDQLSEEMSLRRLCLIITAGQLVTMRVELVGPARENLGFSSIFIPPVKSIISSWRIAMIIPYLSMIKIKSPLLTTWSNLRPDPNRITYIVFIVL